MTIAAPPSSLTPADRSRSVPTALAVAAVLGGVAVLAGAQLLRQEGVPSWNTMWAEDGRRFYTQAIEMGFGSIFEPYDGYYQLALRVLALPAAALPMRAAAPYFAITGAVCTAAIAYGVYVSSDCLINSRVLRSLLALAVALHPLTAFELTANLTNIIWPLSFLTFLALYREPSTTRDTVIAGAISFTGAASQVLTGLFVPIALVLAVRRRSRQRWIVFGAFAAGLGIQIVTALLSGGADNRPTDEARLLPLYVVRVIGTAVFGEEGIRDVWLHFGFASLVLLVPVLVTTLVLTAVIRGSARTDAVVLLAYSLVMFVVPVWFRGTLGMPLDDGVWFSGGSRFVCLSLWFFLAGAFVCVSHLRLPIAWHRVVVGLLAAQFAVLVLVGFRFENGRSDGPSWSASLSEARRTCAIEPDNRVRIQISPPAPGWFVRVGCDRVDG